MKRLFIVSAAWLALFGVVQPLFACAIRSPPSECCPASPQAPCGNDSDGAAPLVELQFCCAPAPPAGPAAIALKKNNLESSHDVASGNGGPAAVPPPTFPPARTRALSSPRSVIDRPDARRAETYLHTGRLRL